jgi:hypothetical protein
MQSVPLQGAVVSDSVAADCCGSGTVTMKEPACCSAEIDRSATAVPGGVSGKGEISLYQENPVTMDCGQTKVALNHK